MSKAPPHNTATTIGVGMRTSPPRRNTASEVAAAFATANDSQVTAKVTNKATTGTANPGQRPVMPGLGMESPNYQQPRATGSIPSRTAAEPSDERA